MGYKILLADDSVTVQKIITLTFSDEGVDVVTVNNGDEAISRLQHLRPALVMADVSIPGRNGYEICEFVKMHPELKDTPVILLVPAFEPFDEDRARRIGADYHLTKPFQSIRTLISTVKDLVEHKTGPELSVVGGGITPVRGADLNNSETVTVDSKRAKIDELIKLSSQASAKDEAEDEVLLEVDLTQGDGRYSNSLAVASAPDVVEVIGAGRAAAVEGYFARPTEAAAQDSRASAEVLDLNMDNILELEDVLPDTTSAIAIDGLADAQPEPFASAKDSKEQGAIVIPQSAIDEIVNRVVTQLSAQLSAQLSESLSAQLSESLSEKLSGEIARRIAPEVAELVKHQPPAAPSAYDDPENLLDID